MTTYSEWIIIPEDRKCDLPPLTKVQMFRCDQTLKSAEETEPSRVFCFTNGGYWPKHFFAYRVVQEPVEEVREYECNARFYEGTTPWFLLTDHDLTTKGTATQTTRDGQPYEFTWRASE